MSKETALLSSTVDDDISLAVSGVYISDKGSICGSYTDNTTTEICANCGKEEGSLKSCAACKLVKYCSRDCQASHRSKHKKECKKRAAELHDIEIFKQPPPKDDCAICFLLLPTNETGRRYKSCCGKIICCGCVFAQLIRDRKTVPLCPFCRNPTPSTGQEFIIRMQKRADVGDVEAFFNLGCYYTNGMYGLPQDYPKALELLHQAAELGHVEAYYNIGCAYRSGHGVGRDMKKAKHYWELAAMRGDSAAKLVLGKVEQSVGNIERAIGHYMIAVGSGCKDSLTNIQRLYSQGYATKDVYTQALRTYQKYLNEVKSNQRDEAAAFDNKYNYL